MREILIEVTLSLVLGMRCQKNRPSLICKDKLLSRPNPLSSYEISQVI